MECHHDAVLASSATFDPANPDIIYAGFGEKGIGKSTDGGVTWTTASQGFAKGLSFRELVVSPTNSQDIYAIGNAGWNGNFYASHDGGKSWTNSSTIPPILSAIRLYPRKARRPL